ncbi:hypothetical protein [Streptomyces sp. NPDC017993]|uniref:hypothetical protein n=1 Tax=Streptomyces sp. NPDC017993 TaxID=3365027 RepID=UPI0037B72AA2
MNTLTKPHTERARAAGTTGTHEPATTPATKDPEQAPATEAAHDQATRPAAAQPSRSRADGMAVASFIFGLLGTLVGNVVLGPCALIFGGLALAHHTNRRGRAFLGMALGVIDLAILLTLVTTDGTVSWHIGG